jgi:plastocyanin
MRIALPLRIFAFAALLTVSSLFAGQAALADDAVTVSVTIKGHKFDPAEIKVPAGKTIKLTVKNEDPTPEEFESHDLNLEKIVTGGNSIVLEFGPLKAGNYDFVGEFHEKSAKGRIVAE